jgi:hypothetical protein
MVIEKTHKIIEIFIIALLRFFIHQIIVAIAIVADNAA